MKLDLGAPVKHLLMDLDGTILGNQGFALSIDFVRRAFSVLKKHGGMRKSSELLLGIHREFGKSDVENTNDTRVVSYVADKLNLTIEEARLELRNAVKMIFPNLKRHFYPVPGSKEFLEWADGKFPLTLATNPVWPPEIVEMRVRWAGIDPSIFGFITHVRLMHAVKPHPEYYLELLDKRGLNARDCLLVGDDVKKDFPATRVGIRVFIVSKPKTTLTVLKTPQGSASAWKGSYSDLRVLLDHQLSQVSSR